MLAQIRTGKSMVEIDKAFNYEKLLK